MIRAINTWTHETDHSTWFAVSAPDHPRWRSLASDRLDGYARRESNTWDFEPEDETEVRRALYEVFGTDGSGVATLDVLIRVDQLYEHARSLDEAYGGWEEGAYASEPGLHLMDDASILARHKLYGVGRLLVDGHGEISYGDGVTLEEGGWEDRTWNDRRQMVPLDGTVLRVEDVPVHVLRHDVPGVEVIGEVIEEMTPEERALRDHLLALEEDRRQLVLDRLEGVPA